MFPKVSLFTKFSLFLTVSEVHYTDLIISHQNNSFDSLDNFLLSQQNGNIFFSIGFLLFLPSFKKLVFSGTEAFRNIHFLPNLYYFSCG